jgi:ABC-type Fe3+/spermidine/putrescine transport system ATPase subunit
VTVAVRPQHIRLAASEEAGLSGQVYEVVFGGLHRTAYARLEDGTVAKFNVEDGGLKNGDAIRLRFASTDALLYAD